jgi:hypothetical protein
MSKSAQQSTEKPHITQINQPSCDLLEQMHIVFSIGYQVTYAKQQTVS